MVADSLGYSPSAAKPRQAVEDWTEHGLPIEIESFQPVTTEHVKLAHDPDFVDDLFQGRIPNGHGNTSDDVARSTLWTVGSLHAAAVEAFNSGIACSPSSGFHHACWDENGGFCTFNGLMVTAIRLLNDGLVGRVSIVDYDFHYGDGTHDIIHHLGFHDCVTQVNGDFSADGRQFLDTIEDELRELGDVGLILYQAGADMHIEDPLGGLLTTEQMRQRDEIVFQWCKRKRIPVTWNLAGGYQREPDGSIPKVLEIHRNTVVASIKSFGSALDSRSGV